jgi:hypothetical protein
LETNKNSKKEVTNNARILSQGLTLTQAVPNTQTYLEQQYNLYVLQYLLILIFHMSDYYDEKKE